MANYPTVVAQDWLANQFTPEDQRVVRVEMRGCYNQRAFSLHGKGSVQYRLSYHPASNAHVLDVPESLWMHDNARFARDLLSNISRSGQLTVLILPRATAEKTTAKAKPLPKAITASLKAKTAEDAAMAVLGG
jgi:hypothetical protein